MPGGNERQDPTLKGNVITRRCPDVSLLPFINLPFRSFFFLSFSLLQLSLAAASSRA